MESGERKVCSWNVRKTNAEKEKQDGCRGRSMRFSTVHLLGRDFYECYNCAMPGSCWGRDVQEVVGCELRRVLLIGIIEKNGGKTSQACICIVTNNIGRSEFDVICSGYISNDIQQRRTSNGW